MQLRHAVIAIIVAAATFPDDSDMVIARLKGKVLSFCQRFRKKPLVASKVAPDAEDFQKKEDVLPVQKNCSDGNGQHNKKGIDVLRMESAGGGIDKNGHSMVVASTPEVAVGELPVCSGGLANGGGEGGADPKMKQAAPPSSHGHKISSRKQKEEMAIGEGKYQRVKSLALLVLLGGRNVVASASSTLVFNNTCSIPIFPSLIPTDGPKINNSTSLSAIGPNHELSVPLPDKWSGIAIFSTGCISDGLGTRNCTTGNCKGRDCTAEDSPVATGLGISSDSYTISTDMGYNVGLTISPMCSGCDCPSASCKAQLESCPHDLRVFDEGTVVACKPGSGLHFSENQCTVPGDYSTSKVSITCALKNVAMEIKISC